MRSSKGVSPLISYVLITGTVISAVGVVLSAGMPLISNMRDTAAIQQSLTTLESLDSAIRGTASGGKYTTQSFTIRSRRGQYFFDEDDNSIFFEIETDSNIISANSKRQIGPVLLSANVGSELHDTVIDSTPCYMMENKYLEACVRKSFSEFRPGEDRRMLGFWKMDQDSGQEVTDLSEHENDGILGDTESSEASDPSWSEGIHDSSLEFDGQDDYVEIPDQDHLDGMENFTIMMWIKPYDTSSTDRDLFWKGSHSSGEPTGMWIDYSESQKLAFLVTDDQNDYSDVKYSDETIQENVWTHLAVTFEGNNEIRMYLNGSEDANSPFPVTDVDSLKATADDIRLGISETTTNDNWYDGKMDEVKVFDRALSEREIVHEFHKKGDESYMNSSELLVHYYNKKMEQELLPDLKVSVNELAGTGAGQGYTKPDQTGDNLNNAKVTARVESDAGMAYNLSFSLHTGSDFLRVDVS